MNMKKGFTLIEIMIVVAIIAILAAIAIPNFMAYRQTAQAKACQSNRNQIKNAAEAYVIKNPSVTLPTMANLTDSSKGAPFLKSAPKCPYGGSYTITQDTTTKELKATCSKQTEDAHKVED